MDRRVFVRNAGMVGLGAAGLMQGAALGACASPVGAGAAGLLGATAVGSIEPELLPLPYAYDALQPFLSAETLRLHHDIHHAGYVKGLKAAEDKVKAAQASGDFSAIGALCNELAFHYSGHLLHSIYWVSVSPNGGGQPEGELADWVRDDFGSFDTFKAQFLAATNAVQGSGWGILAWQPLGQQLVVLQAEKHQNLAQWGVTPILVLDVWEHAYYVDYRNKRSDYTAAFFGVVDWPGVLNRLIEVKGAG